jgi:thioredoxin reductase (NADPH)
VTNQVLIIGSGPAGYTAAIYAARAGLEPIVLAGSVTAGGNLINTTEVENYPGFPDAIMGPDLMDAIREQAERFGTRIEYDDVVALDLGGPVKQATTGNGLTFTSHTVILAMGSEYREIGLAEEKRLGGHGVSYCATCDGAFFRDKDVLVVGGGDSAMTEATFLTRFARKVTVVHRRGELRASKILAERAAADPKIEFAWHSTVTAIRGETAVTGAQLTDPRDGSTREIEASGIFVAIGSDPRSQLLHGQVDLDPAGYVVVDGRTSRTSLPGVFACGDIVDPTYKQAVIAAGSGAVAALDAQEYLENLAASTHLAAAG